MMDGKLLEANALKDKQQAEMGDHLLPVRQRRKISRWLIGALMLVLCLGLVFAAARNPNFGWSVVGQYLFSWTVLRGLWLTLWLTLVSMAMGVIIGTLCAAMRLSSNTFLRLPAGAFVAFFRGTPVLVQLIFWFNLAIVVPTITLGLPFGPTLFHESVNDLITPYTAALLGLGLNEGAYMSEIVRAGILSVDPGQREAARALGMTNTRILWRVILPQSIRIMIPPTGNQVISMLKTTSLVSVISLGDLLYSVQNISARTFQTIPLLLVACVWYMVATTVLSWLQRILEDLLKPKDVSEVRTKARFALEFSRVVQQ